MLRLTLQFATGSKGEFLFSIAMRCANVMLRHNMQGQGYGPTVMEGYFWQVHSDLHNYLNLLLSPKMSPPLILALLRKSVTWNLWRFLLLMIFTGKQYVAQGYRSISFSSTMHSFLTSASRLAGFLSTWRPATHVDTALTVSPMTRLAFTSFAIDNGRSK